MQSYGRSYFCLLNVIFGCVSTEISIQFSTRSFPNRIEYSVCYTSLLSHRRQFKTLEHTVSSQSFEPRKKWKTLNSKAARSTWAWTETQVFIFKFLLWADSGHCSRAPASKDARPTRRHCHSAISFTFMCFHASSFQDNIPDFKEMELSVL